MTTPANQPPVYTSGEKHVYSTPTPGNESYARYLESEADRIEERAKKEAAWLRSKAKVVRMMDGGRS